jgi:hypothetical protein
MGVSEVFGEKVVNSQAEVRGGRPFVLDAAGVVEMARDAVCLLP